MRTETGELVPGPKPRWVARNWWVLVVGLVGLACAAGALIRVARRPARDSNPTNGGTV